MILDATLTKAGFSVPQPPSTRRVVVCSRGLDKRGKTHWAMTAPGPMAIVALDTGTKEVANKFLGNKDLICAYYRVSGPYNDRTAAQEAAEKEWNAVKTSIVTAIQHPKLRTLVVDTGTELWELLRLAWFGKLDHVMPQHYGPVNREMRDLVKGAYERDDLNVVWVHKVKKQYVQNKKGEDSWNGTYEMAGFGDMPYLADITIEHYWRNATEDQPGRFGMRVVGVGRQTPDVCGLELEGEDCTFGMLATLLYPDVDPKWWR